jgi:hypothetical protein
VHRLAGYVYRRRQTFFNNAEDSNIRLFNIDSGNSDIAVMGKSQTQKRTGKNYKTTESRTI